MSPQSFSNFRKVPRTGVIYVMNRAAELGFHYTHSDWANLGQGAPEVGELPGDIERVKEVSVSFESMEYAPVPGERALREKVAQYYNYFYRKGKKSQYTWENVCISGGGRLALTRVVASLGNINLGHFIPDYTAYEEVLGVFKNFVSIPILLDPNKEYRISLEDLEEEIQGRGLGALLLSNPANPTGHVLEGEELRSWVDLGRQHECAFIFDEFYSHYVYGERSMVSAAEYVEDVDEDEVLIIDGMTKNWRYPGWRISWTLGPKRIIESLASAGSFLDGGANHPFQHQAIHLLEPSLVVQKNKVMQSHFFRKQAYLRESLTSLGIRVSPSSHGTFYHWADLSGLPEGINDGLGFFEACLKEKVITVPGIFFDVNPGKRRRNARFQHFARISFGPEMSVLEKGIEGMRRAIEKF